jgi:hypothetical protein
MHDMIDRHVRAFLQGLACGQTGAHGGGLYCAVQNDEFSYRYAAAPRTEAASPPRGLHRCRDRQCVVAPHQQRRMPHDVARKLLATSSHFDCRVPKRTLELNRSAHHWDERNRLLSPENGIGSAIEVVE